MKLKHSLAPGKWSEVLAVPLITLLTLGGLVSAPSPCQLMILPSSFRPSEESPASLHETVSAWGLEEVPAPLPWVGS